MTDYVSRYLLSSTEDTGASVRGLLFLFFSVRVVDTTCDQVLPGSGHSYYMWSVDVEGLISRLLGVRNKKERRFYKLMFYVDYILRLCLTG